MPHAFLIDATSKYIDAGFDHLILVQIGPEQDAFIDFFTRIGANAAASPRGVSTNQTSSIRGRGTAVAWPRPWRWGKS